MTARIYVGTYAKYNSGSIKGAWIDLEEHADKESFLAACRELHADESDPEFMFQDFEGFPKALYSESYVSDKLFEWLDLDESDRELLQVYQNNIDSDADIETARDNFGGKYDSPTDWAHEFLDDTGALNEIPENLRNYFDYEAYARDAQYGGDLMFVTTGYNECWVFWNR